MTHIWLMIDENKNVVAVYDSENLANVMKQPIETKLNVVLTIAKRSVNIDIKVIGVIQ